MSGYDPNFLAQPVPLPEFTPRVAGDVLRRVELRDGTFADYANYTVAMHRRFRTLLFAGLNVDQNLLKKTERSDRWRIDTRIGVEYQLDNAYYYDNPWDRGHLARRATAGWGETEKAAQRAADETFYYSNASLQHRNFNQDEWLALEDWVLNLELDKDNKISVFSGPIFGDYMRTIRPDDRDAAFIPSAYFKVVFFMNKQDKLEVRAFLMAQDEEALRDMKGRRVFDYQIYQVSVTEIEELTGLDFPEVLPKANPLFYSVAKENRDNVNIHELPERREVNGPNDIVRDGKRRRDISFSDDEVDVFIAAALVNPTGNEQEGEWISIINLTTAPVSDGWKLRDHERRTKELKGTIGPGEAMRVQPLSPVMLPNNRAAFVQLIDDQQRQIDRVPYSAEQATREGKPIVFA